MYQLHFPAMNSGQKVEAANLGGTTIDPRERRGAKNPASKPVTS